MSTPHSLQNVDKQRKQYIVDYKYNDAISFMLSFIETHPQLHYKLADIYMMIEQCKNAKIQFQLYLQHDDTNAIIYYKLGWIYHHFYYDDQNVQQKCQKSLDINPADAKRLLYLGKLMLYQFEQFDDAFSLRQKCLDIKENASIWHHIAILSMKMYNFNNTKHAFI